MKALMNNSTVTLVNQKTSLVRVYALAPINLHDFLFFSVVLPLLLSCQSTRNGRLGTSSIESLNWLDIFGNSWERLHKWCPHLLRRHLQQANVLWQHEFCSDHERLSNFVLFCYNSGNVSNRGMDESKFLTFAFWQSLFSVAKHCEKCQPLETHKTVDCVNFH